ncbi:HpsJ family protein [Leptolyngbya ohadii]|uniref:HpsJ family protein n=1 Tax=Leptolyngbya ohadii TaxID=1962290 RepID=UPI001179F23A|nr:HpsJ family protein [Leptolyngbya ohadii]
MKAVLSPTGYAALILKLIGGLMVMGSIADCLVLLIPPNFLDQEWLTALIRGWILYGPIPLIGFALLLLGVWIESLSPSFSPSPIADRPAGKKASKRAGKRSAQSPFVSSITFLSLCYCILFLLMVPLYFNSSRLASASATRNLNQQAQQAEQALNDRLDQRREQINLLISDSAQRQAFRAQLEDSSQNSLSPEQQTELQQLLDLVQRVQKDPSVLEEELTQAQQAGLEEIKAEQQQQRDRITAETRKLRLHTILTALILAIGFGGIAWTGMALPQKRPVRRKAQA